MRLTRVCGRIFILTKLMTEHDRLAEQETLTSSSPDIGAEELEPIEILLSDGRRIPLSTDVTRHIWQAVRAGRASSPKQFILRAFGVPDDQEELPTSG
jgi:hypothetical protein